MSGLSKNIKKLLEDHYQENLNGLFDSSKGKDIVVFLGSSGAGKSTLINYLNDIKMIINKDEEFQILYPNDPTYMKIGMGSLSETLFPRSIQKESLVFYDLPGFDDTRGTGINMINASFIKNIIESANSVRLVFVAGYDEVTSCRGSSFKKLLKFTELLINKDIALQKSSLLVITKSAKDNSSNLVEFLEQKFHDTEDLKTWLQPDRCLPMSRRIDPKQKQDILTTIMNLSPSKIEKVNIQAILNADVTNDLRQILQSEMNISLEKIQSMYPKNLKDIPKIIEAIQYFKNSFEGAILIDLSTSNLMTILKSLSDAIYIEELDLFKKYVKQNILLSVTQLEGKKLILEKEIIEKQAEERSRQQAIVIERQRLEQIQQAAENRRMMEQAMEQQRKAAQVQRQQAAEMEKYRKDQLHLKEEVQQQQREHQTQIENQQKEKEKQNQGPSIEDGMTIILFNQESNLALATDDEGNITTQVANGSDYQKWVVKEKKRGRFDDETKEYDLYEVLQFYNVATGEVLGLDDNNKKVQSGDGSRQSSNQLWEVISEKNGGVFKLINYDTEQFLGSNADGLVKTMAKNSTTYYKWIFTALKVKQISEQSGWCQIQ